MVDTSESVLREKQIQNELRTGNESSKSDIQENCTEEEGRKKKSTIDETEQGGAIKAPKKKEKRVDEKVGEALKKQVSFAQGGGLKKKEPLVSEGGAIDPKKVKRKKEELKPKVKEALDTQ